MARLTQEQINTLLGTPESYLASLGFTQNEDGRYMREGEFVPQNVIEDALANQGQALQYAGVIDASPFQPAQDNGKLAQLGFGSPEEYLRYLYGGGDQVGSNFVLPETQNYLNPTYVNEPLLKQEGNDWQFFGDFLGKAAMLGGAGYGLNSLMSGGSLFGDIGSVTGSGSGGGAGGAVSAAADPIEAMYQLTSGNNMTANQAASALGFDNFLGYAGSINPAWVSPVASAAGAAAGASGGAAGGGAGGIAGSAAGAAGTSALGSLLGGNSQLGSLGSVALGGLLGSLNGSKQTGEQVTKQVPWDAQQPYLIDLFQKAKQASEQTSTPTADQTAALNSIRGLQNSPYLTQAADYYNSVMNNGITPNKNPMLGMDNPYLNRAISDAQGDVSSRINSQFNQNAFGGTAHQQTLARELGRVSNDMRMTDYGRQQGLYENDVTRNLQSQQFNRSAGLNAASGLQNVYQNQFMAPNALYQMSQNYQNQPFNALQNYSNVVRGNYGGSTSSPIYSNPYLGALGGAMAGSQIYKSIFGK